MTIKPVSSPVRKTRKTSPRVVKKQVRRIVSCGPIRFGESCPQCRRGKLDYDGLLNLVCPTCGYNVPGAGGFS